MKVAIYCRVSKEETNKDDRRYQDPENQLQPLRDWAKQKQWDIISEYIDRGSGADPNRPEFRKMLRDAMMLKFTSILIWKFDRFSREPMFVAVGRIQKLRNRNIGIKSLTESWLDTGKDNPMSDLTLSILAWASAIERTKISERTKAGIQRRKNLGVWKGGRPKKLIKEGDHKLIEDLYNNKKSILTISRKIKVSKDIIKSYLEKRGLLET